MKYARIVRLLRVVNTLEGNLMVVVKFLDVNLTPLMAATMFEANKYFRIPNLDG